MIGQGNAKTDHATVLHQASLNDARQHGHVDVAAAEDDGNFLIAQAGLVPEHGGHAGGARALRQGFLLFQKPEDGHGDLLVVHRENLVDVFFA